MVAAEDEPCAFAKLWGQLDGLPFHCYMTSLPSTLGRGSSATEGSRKPAGFIDLGKSKALSREHATISWIPAQKKYQITCQSKNGMVVAGKYHAKGGVEKLESRTPIKLGPALMYFLLPESTGKPLSRLAAKAVSTPNAAPGPKRPLAPSKAPTNPPQPQTNAAAVTAPTAQTPAPAAATAPAVATAPAPSTNPFYGMVLGAFRSPALSAIASAGGLSSGDVQNWVMQNYPEWNQEGAKMRTLAVGIEAVLAKDFVANGGDRWTYPSVEPSSKRAKISPDGAATASTGNGATATTAAAGVAKDANGGGGGGHVNGGGAMAAASVSAEGNAAGEEDGGGIDVGMDG